MIYPKKKAAVFCANNTKDMFRLCNVEEVRGDKLPEAVLSCASFPCQDLSLAGNMSGISGERSGLVWQWLRIMDEMKHKPPIAVAENVVGLVSVAKGAHYKKLHNALVERGYRVGAVILDAIHWVPQSRKRVFVIAIDKHLKTNILESDRPLWCHPLSIQRAAEGLEEWIWWSIHEPLQRKTTIEDIVDINSACDDEERRLRLLSLIPPKHLDKLLKSTDRLVFPGYKCIRHGEQVLELRFDGVAGCLRTPEGGSSRQFLVIKQNDLLNTRLLTVKEAAALMGVRKDYRIPGGYNDGYKAMGDTVAVPVVRYLGNSLLAPLANIAMGISK
jgi:DNA (cytosine-5)-methyltransferase 1